MVNKKIGIKNIGKNKKHAKNKNNNKQLLKQEKVSSKKIFKISLIVLLTLIVLVLLFLLISYKLVPAKMSSKMRPWYFIFTVFIMPSLFSNIILPKI